jgi:hypothetical protein
LGFFFILKVTSALAAKSVIPIELLATKATDSMGRVFVHIVRSAIRAPWRPADEKKDGDCDDTQDDGAGDNPNKGAHVV